MARKEVRYPGARPFSRLQGHIFFGREQNIRELHQLVKLENLILLFAKSGLGKSSLLNAGLVPEVEDKDELIPITFRFGANSTNNPEPPLEKAKAKVADSQPLLDRIKPTGEDSLWYSLKSKQLKDKDHQGFLLIFDQFEELFTYKKSAIADLGKALSELLYTNIPDRFRKNLEAQLESDTNAFTAEELNDLHEPLGVRIILAIRSDRMSELSKLQPYLNRLLEHLYELKPLSNIQAEAAILSPAYEEGDFFSPNFDYTDPAVEHLVEFLSEGGTETIESFQLQIICEYIEKNLVVRQGKKLIKLEDVQHPEVILENYYQNKIEEISNPEDRQAARELIEEGLIFEEEQRRLSLYEGQLVKTYNISPELLNQLLDTHLIRSEPSIRGGYTYELSHDTLVGPVLKAKNERLAERRKRKEEEARAKREAELQRLRAEAEAEKQQAQKEKQLREQAEANSRKAKRNFRIASILAILAMALTAFAVGQYVASQNARQKAEDALEQMLQAQTARKAIEAQKLVTDAKTYIMAREYELAIEKLEEAVEANPENKEAKRLLEFARKEAEN
ncbi:MAG: hypothetical protein GYB31_08855 [Bacteroidetes bacterium]|nr:hypothetical protein [Bacteroidota bacterium]